MTTIRVLLADGHPIVRAGLRAMVEAESGMEVVGEAGDAMTTVAIAANGAAPDVAVVGDVSAPELDGTELIARLRQDRPTLRVLALSDHARYIFPLLSAGAGGCVSRRATAAELVRAVRAVAAGDAFPVPAEATPPPDGGLSEREAEVVRLIAWGYSNKEIATRLKLSVKTVETYKARSMEKLGVHTRVDIVRHAVARGWLADTRLL